MWKVTIDGKEVIYFPHELQCKVWCYEKGLVWTSYRTGDKLQENVKIEEVK